MSTLNPTGWRPSAPSTLETTAVTTTTGNRALMLEEPLLFEIGKRDQTGVDFEAADSGSSRLGGLAQNRRTRLSRFFDTQIGHQEGLAGGHLLCDAWAHGLAA